MNTERASHSGPGGEDAPEGPGGPVGPVGSAGADGSGVRGGAPAAEPGGEPGAEPGRERHVGRRSWWRGGRPASWRGLLLQAVVVTLGVLLFSRFVVQPFQIPSGSMEPTLRTGDRVLVNKLAYGDDSPPRRGDLIVFDGEESFVHSGTAEENPVSGAAKGVLAAVGLMDSGESDFVKRVVGVGGDRVVCCDRSGRMSVNGVALDERSYLRPGDAPSEVPFDIVVPPGRLWVMGDHRSDSRDSRDLLGSPGGGMVPVERVVGRVDWIGWPVGRWSSVERGDVFARVPDAPAAGHAGAAGPEPGGAHG